MLSYPKQDAMERDENKIYADFEQRADVFVSKLLDGCKPLEYHDIKVIHDPVWGTIKFYPWELQLLDSPLLQRLRNINQLGLASITYPSAHHSRFEHTLGVVSLVAKMVDSINDSYRPMNEGDKNTVGAEELGLMRLAAILHDVGHSFFSHLSEKMYGDTKEFMSLKSSFEIFSKAQPHEVLAYVIINTPSFKSFFKACVSYPYITMFDSVDLMFDSIGRMIVGAPIEQLYDVGSSPVKKYYLTEIINGQFDADSLDYLRRDSYITGLSLTYHIDRFLYKIKLVDRSETVDGKTVTGRHLTVPVSGVSTVEEIIFGKQMLTRYIYQHQKVLAADALVYDIVGGLRQNGKLLHPCDFLYYCDNDIYKIYDESGDPDFIPPISKMPVNNDSSRSISDMVKRIKNRDIPKKALVINLFNISELYGKKDFTLEEAYNALKEAMSHGFRKAVRDEAKRICVKANLDPSRVDLFDIFYSVPKPTTAKNYTDVYVATHDGQYAPLNKIADLNDWADEFSGRSWNVYVYSFDELLPVVGLAARNVLCSKGIGLYNDKIFENLKTSKKILELLNALGN